MEERSAYKFYYNGSELESFSVTLDADHQPLPLVLRQLFQNSPYHFVIDPLKHVYITRNTTIQADLPPRFFDPTAPQVADNSREPVPVTTSSEKLKIKASIENKLFEIGTKSTMTGKAVLAGYVRDEKNGEPVSGASIYVDSLSVNAVTDQFGYYSLTLPKGKHTLQINSPGMKNTHRQILLYGDGKLNIELQDYIPSLREVVVTAERRSNVRGLQMGLDKLTIKTIRQVPVVFGEADVLKVVMTLPGVTSTGEASAGFNVRGGAADQNLILFNDATIYNPSHLFGFFAAFNPDVIKGVELYKSAIPERYGGRLSSVLDVTTREGNSKKISGTGGIGLLTSKLTLEGPIVKDKTSFIVSGRTTYSDWLLQHLPDRE